MRHFILFLLLLLPLSVFGQVKTPATSRHFSNDTIITPPGGEKKVKEKKRSARKRHLVWTGWKTGFHWSTPGKQ